MSRIDSFDALKKEDWKRAYADVPDCVEEGVYLAFARIRARERRRKSAVRALACAACLVVLIGAAGLALRRDQEPIDRVAAPRAELQMLAEDSIVYAAQADPYFHLRRSCPSAMAEQVQLKLITALEFEKEICPECGANVRLPED